jgi:voltage-gated potassium channel
MHKTATRLLVLLHRLVRHPVLTVTIAFVIVSLALSLAVYLFERRHGPPYETYFSTLKAVIPVLIISGMDVSPPPESFGGLLCSYVLMVLGIVYIAVLTAVITTEFVLHKLSRGISMGTVKFENHILMCGWVKGSRELLKQLFAPDLKEHSPVVIVDPDIEEAPLDHPLLKVVKGDPADTAVLERANARRAKAAIILADREAGDANASDARSALIALAVETIHPQIYSCVEVLNPENKKHFEHAHVDEVISVTEISNHLVVQAALNPGVASLIADMLSFGEGEEVYEAPVPPAFVGKTFADLAIALLRERGMVLIGTRSDGEIVRSQRSRWRFKPGDAIFVLSEEEPTDLQGVQCQA